MTESKEWDWAKNNDIMWLEPCEESYYYCNKWRKAGKRSILDLGCGLGRHSILFAREGFDVTATDLSEYAVKNVEEWRLKEDLRITTAICDMKKLPFPDKSFDCIWAYYVISHTDSVGFLQILSEIQRVLRTDGEMYFTLCSKQSKAFHEMGFPKIDDSTIIKTLDGPEKGIPHFHVNLEDIIRLLSSFEIISIRHVEDCIIDGNYVDGKHYFICVKNHKLT